MGNGFLACFLWKTIATTTVDEISDIVCCFEEIYKFCYSISEHTEHHDNANRWIFVADLHGGWRKYS